MHLNMVLVRPYFSLSTIPTPDVHWQPVAYSSSSLSPTEQCYAQIEKETLAIVHAFQKFDQLLFGKSGITIQ